MLMRLPYAAILRAYLYQICASGARCGASSLRVPHPGALPRRRFPPWMTLYLRDNDLMNVAAAIPFLSTASALLAGATTTCQRRRKFDNVAARA